MMCLKMFDHVPVFRSLHHLAHGRSAQVCIDPPPPSLVPRINPEQVVRNQDAFRRLVRQSRAANVLCVSRALRLRRFRFFVFCLENKARIAETPALQHLQPTVCSAKSIR